MSKNCTQINNGSLRHHAADLSLVQTFNVSLLPVGCNLSVQLLPDHSGLWVAGRSTVKYHVGILFGDDVFGTFDDPRLL